MKDKILQIADVHGGHPVMPTTDFSLYVLDDLLSIVEKYGKELFLVVFLGDTYDRYFHQDSLVVEQIRSFFSRLCKLSIIYNFKIRVIEGTKGHEKGMLSTLYDMTRYGSIYGLNASGLETRITNTVDNIKEHFVGVINGKEDTLREDIKNLYQLYHDVASNSEQKADFLIYSVPTVELINGNSCLFLPEYYGDNPDDLKDILLQDYDIVFLHGLIDGAIPVLNKREDKTALQYNKSITIKTEWLCRVKKYTVAGHIHTRTFFDWSNPYEKKKKPSLWYTGSVISHNMSDAGQRKGIDLVTINDNSWEVEFIETKHSPKFEIIDITRDIMIMELDKMIVKYIGITKKDRDIKFRFDLDSSNLEEKHNNKFKEFRARFKNIQYKITNSVNEKTKLKEMKEKQSLLKLPILEIAKQFGMTNKELEEILK